MLKRKEDIQEQDLIINFWWCIFFSSFLSLSSLTSLNETEINKEIPVVVLFEFSIFPFLHLFVSISKLIYVVCVFFGRFAQFLFWLLFISWCLSKHKYTGICIFALVSFSVPEFSSFFSSYLFIPVLAKRKCNQHYVITNI